MTITAPPTAPDDAVRFGTEIWAHVAGLALMLSSSPARGQVVKTGGAFTTTDIEPLFPTSERHRLGLEPDPERGWRGSHPLLAVHGHTWIGSHLPRRYTRGMMRACYQNTWSKVSRSRTLIYCEGYGASTDLGIPMMHAWAYDPDSGTIIEPTWETRPDEPFKHAYVGLAMPTELVREARARSFRHKIISVLDGDYARDGWFHREGWIEAVRFTRELFPND